MFTAGTAVLFCVGLGLIAGAERAYPQRTAEHSITTLCGLVNVVIGIRAFLTDPLHSYLPAGYDILAMLLVQVGVGLVIYFAVQYLVRSVTETQQRRHSSYR